MSLQKNGSSSLKSKRRVFGDRRKKAEGVECISDVCCILYDIID